MKIVTITQYDGLAFDQEVNKFLGCGWELHGPPNITTLTELHAGMGTGYSIIKTVYVQVLKK